LFVLFVLVLFSQFSEFFLDHEEIFIMFFTAITARVAVIRSQNIERTT